MHLTSKQIELLTVIAKGNGPKDPSDLDEILDRLKYDTSKQSLQFSIRALIAKGLIIKLGISRRRGRHRQVLQATELGRQMVGVKDEQKPDYVQALEDPDLDIPMDDDLELPIDWTDQP